MVIAAGSLSFPDLNSNAKPIGTCANLAALVNHLGYIPAQNAMNLELEMLKDGKPVDSSLESKRSYLISECLKSGLPKSVIDDHLMALCERNKYHPVKAYLDNEVWDGIKRIDSLIEAMNPKDMRIAKAVMTKWLVACVAALYESHFSCKIVPILQGGQSFKKTAFISRFANVIPGSFLEGAELNPDNKDSLLSCIKSWIVELGELERTSKNSQGSLKAFITKANDSVRPPYGRSDIKKMRQTTLIATVNGTEFLRDETGSSRYAVIELEKAIDMVTVNHLLGWEYQDGRTTHIAPDKLKQLWLEAKSMYENGASWELSASELDAIAKVNQQHNFKGNWYEVLEGRFVDVDMEHRHFEWMKASEICSYFDIANNHVRMVGKALKMMAEDGLLEVKKGRARSTHYRIPVISEK
ncbi:virulence-associated E family protein [Photobacterium proteolyticum]|uniref:Virulence-associated E family protein n=2 Tax=Photobacterium proteolyticum TaxID=1903952 RepID=A0A1Q9GSD1_9GAMM|nr:virulence-associated E family protein [Photobacterium proteolyticum]